ncbi:ATP-dependent helicase [Acidisoma cellulosilytica]|uniref:ATP-dependent helicase n=1 Tax=Acidisoma cellulosilyticum TaxID=2802395 RepID=A0A964E4F6_9PROT|nr:DEAD/DEAH box helicase [Acidisoma cellulosilyticum]MCB8881416.1 ATP-dependent helicase [Acidisoma cellulosilyticum]
MSAEVSTRAAPTVTPFSTEDLSRVFDAAMLRRGRSLILLEAVTVSLKDASITVVVEHIGVRYTASITPSARGSRVGFLNRCSCGQSACSHVAAGALAALDRFPVLRRPEQTSLLSALSAPAQAGSPPPAAVAPGVSVAGERQRLVFELSPGEPPHACFVATLLIGERTGAMATTTPARILADRTSHESSRIMARMLGAGIDSRVAVAPAGVASVLGLLPRLKARWHANKRPLVQGEERAFQANLPPDLPADSAVILGDTGPWYVDAASGAVGRVRLRQAATPQTQAAGSPRVFRPAGRPANNPTFQRPEPPAPRFTGKRPAPTRSRYDRDEDRRPDAIIAAAAGPVILEQPPVPVIRLRKVDCPDDFGHMQHINALTMDFDYQGVLTPGDDERQFLPLAKSAGGGGQSFIRRDRAAETAALDTLRQDGLSQMRIAEGASAKGRMVFVYRGRDASERWQTFVAERAPALERSGWRNLIDRDFGPSLVETVGDYDVRVEDAESGTFSLDFGIEIDGTRSPLLPILSRLLDRGGIDAAKIIDGELITSLDDGRILKLPADRIRRLLAVMGDLIEAARRSGESRLLLENGEAGGILDLEDLLITRWENASAIEAYAQNFRGGADIPAVTIPATFTATLRPYQQQGVDWLQHLRSLGLGGFLADDMGLGKTAQTIAHIVIEGAEGRLDRPALIVVPTSLVTNWTAELSKFAPHLRVAVLHGLDRHERRSELDGVHVVITTYTVLARDIEEMKRLSWHLVVLDEAQVIKSPDAKATRAVCQLDTRHRLCLSGTPIENNLQELWSEFAFLNPGLLGDRKGFAKRFRTPIEKNNDAVRRLQLIRRIKPFLLRRTKAEVATDLPPKHTILRRINLAADQRELYETIRATLHDEVRDKVAELTAAQGRIVVLDALLKLRQVCCDPRLVKLPSARAVESSSKLDELLDMITEMIPEGRRILLFSQFTTMLDLIKPRLVEAGVKFVELRGDTRDRAEPVRAFENGEVALFLISLKAGGRGLNLTSADTVIHYDPWWNPAAEDQASDRAHRIGQTKPVFVYKMIAADTVEDRIVELQRRKADLANIALSAEGDFSGVEIDDVEFLFGTGSAQKLAA